MRNARKPSVMDYVQAAFDEVWYGMKRHGPVLWLLMVTLLALNIWVFVRDALS